MKNNAALPSNASSLLLLAVAVLAAACITSTVRPDPGAAGLTPLDPAAVRVSWAEPEVEYRRIGEVRLSACQACSLSMVEAKLRRAVARLGGDLAIVTSVDLHSHFQPPTPNSPGIERTTREIVAIAARRAPTPPGVAH